MPSKNNFSNNEVVQQLKEVMAAMQISGTDRFRIRAYDMAISSLENLTISIQDLWEDGRVNQVPGIGPSITQHINELFENGKVNAWESAKKDFPEGMFELIGIRGIGPKKAFKLAKIFNLNNRETAVDSLKEHAEKLEIQVLPGFGQKSEADILEALENSKKTKNEKPRMLLYAAEQIASRVLSHMKKLDCIEKIDVLGSYRRRNPTVGDLDFVVATREKEKVIEHFLEFPEIAEVLANGENKVMVVLTNDTQVDLRISTPEAFGAMLQYNTGNVQHNIMLRTHALAQGLSLSEYGIKSIKTKQIKEFSEEEDFYKYLGLQYIPPELRYGYDEIEKARENAIPKLINLQDLKGDIHSHSTHSDGAVSIEEMAKAAVDRGYEYFGISDHAPSVTSRGMGEVERIILETRKEIDTVTAKLPIKVLFGYEVNILVNNQLSLPDELLEKLDYVIAGVHTSLNQDKDTMTQRILSALENPYVDILAHPLNRIINSREACDINWVKVFDAAKANNKILEIDSQPDRLDLSDDLVKQAVEKGIRLVINSDAHASDQLERIKYGIDVARRGWCTKENIINTLDYSDFVKALDC